MIEPVELVIGIAIGVLCAAIVHVVAPSNHMCLAGFYLEGVRPDGRYTCRRSPANDEDQRPFVHVLDDLEYPGFVTCTGGTEPIVVNYRTVGCQPGGWNRDER